MDELQLFKVYRISIHLYCSSHVGREKNSHQPSVTYNIMENSPTSLAHNFVFNFSNGFEFGKETCYLVFQAIAKF